jgi:hypothetical protein
VTYLIAKVSAASGDKNAFAYFSKTYELGNFYYNLGMATLFKSVASVAAFGGEKHG